MNRMVNESVASLTDASAEGPTPGQEDRRAADAEARAEREAFSTLLSRLLRSGEFRFGDHTVNWLRSIIWERVVASGAGSARAYVPLLDDPTELARLQEAIRIRETRFFRAPAYFALLREDVLPALWFHRGSDTPLTLWSSGCATGEEAYSLAMTLLDAASRTGIASPVPGRVIASDVNGGGLTAARSGVYSDRALANVPTDVRARYFTRAGKGWRVAEAPRRLVEFQRWSLAEDDWPLVRHSVDVLFCHDVLPFFSCAMQQAILGRFYETLTDGGYLILGRGEQLVSPPAGLEAVHLPSVSFFQRTG